MTAQLTAQKRLDKEFSDISDNPPPGVSASLVDDENLFKWSAILCGPDNSGYAGGFFEIELDFPQTYPTHAPRAKFLSNMFHPNIYTDGRVCIDILGGNWKPSHTPSTILFAIQAMLSNPNPDSPANREAADLFVQNKVEFWERVQKTISD